MTPATLSDIFQRNTGAPARLNGRRIRFADSGPPRQSPRILSSWLQEPNGNLVFRWMGIAVAGIDFLRIIRTRVCTARGWIPSFWITVLAVSTNGKISLQFLLSLNIKNPEVKLLAAEVARIAKETTTEAIRRALLERKVRLAIRP